MLEFMHRFEKLSIMPECEHIGAAEYLEKNLKNNENLAVWDGELYLEMHRGTFTTKADLKKTNRRLEYKFRNAEIISLMRGENNQKKITELYKRFLVNQFHDILPGSHIRPVYEDAVKDYEYIEAELDKIIGSGTKYFNSLNIPRNALTFVENKKGSATRYSKKGNWLIPAMSPMQTKSLRAKYGDNSWLNAKGLKAETPF